MNGTPWTPERVERLQVLAAQGAIGSEIAAEFGMTRNAVIGKIHRMIALGMIAAWAGASDRLKDGRTPKSKLLAPKRRKRWRPSPMLQGRKEAELQEAVAAAHEAGIIKPPRRKHRRPCKPKSLKPDSCRWPMWGPDTPPKDWRFCNTIVVKGCSYCAEHCGMAYKPVRQRDAA
jgi:GcrA cell cycle regulator